MKLIVGKQRPAWTPEHYQILRKEANFGCAKCGKPLVTIHHIEGYEDGILEKPEKLLALCKVHHEESDKVLQKLKKKLPLSDKEVDYSMKSLYSLKKEPFNKGVVHHAFKIASDKEMTVNIGGNVFVETPIPLQIFGEPIISVRREGDEILFSAKFYDINDQLRLKIIDNFWEADTELDDVRYSEEGSVAWVSIKMNNSDSYLEFKVKNDELNVKGKFYRRGQLFEVNESGVFSVTRSMTTFTGCKTFYCQVGISIE